MTTRSIRCLAAVIAVLLMHLVPGRAGAMDPRFELDFKSIDGAVTQKSPAAKKPEKEKAPQEKSHKTAAKKTAAAGKRGKAATVRAEDRSGGYEGEGYSLKMVAAPRLEQDNPMDTLSKVWDKLLPGKGILTRGKVDVRTGKFVLTLDPEKYPVLSASDGVKILIDRNRSLPPLVKNLLMENEKDIRVVAEDPADRRKFISSVLTAANFHSVAEDATLDFGSEPKLVVQANYKIEKTPDSLLQHDMILLNVDRYRSGMPTALVRFLKKEGFQVVESVPVRYDYIPKGNRQYFQIAANDPQSIADSFMSALSLRFDRDRSLDVLGFREQGVNLKITADRYFEDNGDKYVVSLFNGDAVSYTLVRLMETGGYKVIILDKGDDLRTVTEKFISRLHLNGNYGTHNLWDSGEVPYNLEVSGAMIRDGNREKTVMITSHSLDPLARELAEINGFRVSSF